MPGRELNQRLAALARITAHQDAREGGHRHAGEALHLLSVMGRAMQEATPEQLDRLRDLAERWPVEAPPPTTPQMARQVEALMGWSRVGEIEVSDADGGAADGGSEA